MDKYELELDSYNKWRWSHAAFAVLFSETPVNIIALASLFKSADGVNHAEINGFLGDDDNITAEDNRSHLEFKFSVGWGDCPAGCIQRHFWKFNVHPDGTVEYTGSEGSPLFAN